MIVRTGPVDGISLSFAGTEGESDDGPIAVENFLVTGWGNSATVGTGGGGGGGEGGFMAWTIAVAVSVLTGPDV